MDRYDYINTIIDHLRGRTGMNFQRLVREVLRGYCDFVIRQLKTENAQKIIEAITLYMPSEIKR